MVDGNTVGEGVGETIIAAAAATAQESADDNEEALSLVAVHPNVNNQQTFIAIRFDLY